ncbi:hypothetical protein KUTeg_007781 [Tegillarca granosa]|uniref:RING-type domain-containing protein n=1 Tax=Tegillarca granosa TaxID=220873 RepID=A0ABQ9FG63_TEGGR|nr:hypothetical protein KUTeg_007781 [Tegillarca granosa]
MFTRKLCRGMEDGRGQSLRTRLSKYQDNSSLRRATILEHWPKEKTFISADDLVKDGFFCTGKGDRVQCCYCGGILNNWQKTDKVHVEHSRLFGQCPLIKNPYKCPEYADKLPRLKSFDNWPHQLKQKPEDLAHAGFFYLGLGDKTQCFWCGGILCDWEEADEPVIEHIKWFSKCPWMYIINDKDFVENCIKATPQSSVEEKVKSRTSVGSLVAAILEIEETMNTGTSPRDVPPRPPSGQFMDVKSLKKENEDMRERSNCKICREAEVNVVFVPCGHLVCCLSCSHSLRKCPICRKTITRSVKIFWYHGI